MATPLPPEVTAQAERDEAVVVVDHQGRIVLMNGAAEKLFDVALSDVEGEFVELLVPEKLRWGHQAYRRGYLAEPNPRQMDPGLDPHLERPTDGTLIPISVWLEPVRTEQGLFVAARVTPRATAD